ncbi:hypothetical protein [Halovivax limisalsi]|uniref:hypothetical protein n=1 Tax=Halovivax limisalsi TaxID=1453760 RepID=UPI001FFD2506|nr:hypothetical protein [Halovivax limisalsi]
MGDDSTPVDDSEPGDDSAPDEEPRKAEQGQYGGTEDAQPDPELDEGDQKPEGREPEEDAGS